MAANGSAIKLVNAPTFGLQNGRAKATDLLGLSSSLGEPYAPTSDQLRARTDQGRYPCYGPAAFSGVADGSLAGAGDDYRLLAGDGL